MTKIYNIISLFLIIISFTDYRAFSQSSNELLSYADYLFQEEEYYRSISEYLQFKFLYASTDDDSAYCNIQIIKCYYLGKEYKEAIRLTDLYLSGKKIKNPLVDNLYYYGGLSYLQLGYPSSAILYFNNLSSPKSKLLKGIIYLKQYEWQTAKQEFDSLNEITDKSISTISRELSKVALQGNNLRSRSPLLAGVSSAIIPGAGYIYTGNYQTGFASLILNSLLIGASYELNRKGLKFTSGLFFLITLGWYIGNIFGSVTSAINFNDNERRNYIQSSLKNYEFLFR